MGSGSSRLSDRRPTPTNFKRRLSSLLCGSSSSQSTAEMEDYPVGLVVNSAGFSNSVSRRSQALYRDSVLRSAEEIRFTGSKSEEGSLSGGSSIAQSNIESAGKGKRSMDGTESVRVQRLQKESSTSCVGGQSSTDLYLENSGRVPSSDSDVQTEIVGSSSVVPPPVSSSGIGPSLLEDDRAEGGLSLDLGFLMSNRIQGSNEENVLHIDITDVSSSDFAGIGNEISSREARRNSSTFASRHSRRRADFPPFLFATDDDDIIAYRQSLLLGFGSSNLNDGMSDDLWHLGRRSHFSDEQRPHSRSELWGRLRGRTGERGGRITCPSGLHPNGSCLCGLEDDSSGRSSMSRIMMLAEALFEVLDELHQQPISFGLSLLSNPAPESTVDSLPVKSYQKSTPVESGDDDEQCYICLEEYEAGDEIRVLPCTHEYHRTCVDKWLKEIHGVCPLCRGDVRRGTPEGSAQDSNGSSMPVDLV